MAIAAAGLSETSPSVPNGRSAQGSSPLATVLLVTIATCLISPAPPTAEFFSSIPLSALLDSVPQAVLFYAALCGAGVFIALAAAATSSQSRSSV